MDEATRRLTILERQCCAGPGPGSRSSITLQHETSHGTRSYASATGNPSSYARVHGQVSRAAAQWRTIDRVAKEFLLEVKYAKCDEGIAKVGEKTGASLTRL